MAQGLHYFNTQFNDGGDLVRTDPRGDAPGINVPVSGIGLFLGEDECYVPRRPQALELCGGIPCLRQQPGQAAGSDLVGPVDLQQGHRLQDPGPEG